MKLKILAHAKNIKWDADATTLKKLPKSVDVKMTIDTNDCAVDDSGIECELSDIVTNKYGYCHDGFTFSYELDPDDILRKAKKILAQRLKKIQKGQESYNLDNRGKIDWEKMQADYRKDFADLQKLGVVISRDQFTNKIKSLAIEAGN